MSGEIMLLKLDRISLTVTLAICLCLLSSLALADPGGVLHVAGPWGPKTLDVQRTGYVFKRLGVVENLIEVNENLKLESGLAESWTVSPDNTTWTFTLRQDVRFHDGMPLTAGAVKASLERLQQVGSVLKDVPLKSIEAPDDATLVLTTTEPFAPLAAYLSMGETAPLAASSFDASGEVVQPVGTGPFVFESWKAKEEVVTARNDAYWGPKAKVSRVVYRSVPDAVTRLAMLRAGDLDIAQILPPEAIDSLATSGKFDILRMPIGRCRMMGLNMAKEPFSDIRVRKVVNLAVNREDLVNYVLEGVGESATTLYPPMVYWTNGNLAGFPFDPAKAKELLAEAGWVDSDGDGVLDKDGKPLKIKLVTYTERAALPPTAEVVQAQLREVGFDVELAVTVWEAADAMRKQGDFDMFLVGRGLLFVPDPDYNLMTDYFSDHCCPVNSPLPAADNWHRSLRFSLAV
ncbi:ABC transporter substrate-binding protein [Oceanidesulfovibrio indonesiensis]|uniref:ABC transporter substrate-binding protein n=2 Tax=Oceanidesulfovibrio indonesiensis TaxID=54767 RepID=A0A7M3MA70_9BACT|nr:ABC transporter substrate-binding protein [Oceanidesulfovibrio indonesiensis]